MGWHGPMTYRQYLAWIAFSDPKLWDRPPDPNGIIPVVTQEIIDKRRQAEMVVALGGSSKVVIQ